MESKDKTSVVSGISDQMPTETEKKSEKKSKKRKHMSDCSDSDDGKSKKSKSKHKKCKKRHKQAKVKKHKQSKSKNKSHIEINSGEDEPTIGPDIPCDLLKKAQSMAPMSKEEWEKKQNTIRRVFDAESGRTRLVRGQGEIMEEIVSREQHKQINRKATQGDGNFFQSNIKKYV